VPFQQIEQDTYSVVKRVIPAGKTTCGLCSRLRRGALYNFARRNGVTRIALGHHRDDIIETLFLNLFNGGRLKAMPPKLLSDDGAHVVIRPLAYCGEEDIARYADLRQFPLIPCDLCGSQPNLQRQAIKAMLKDWQRTHPGRIENIFRAIANVSPSQLADRELFDFINLGGGDATAGSPAWLAPDDAAVGLPPQLRIV
jgi:tRNA 2-thiocytidine biosynthesis protein TtcA